MQTWIVEAAGAGFAAASAGLVWAGERERERDDGVRVRVRIAGFGGGAAAEVECFPGSVVFARGYVEAGVCNASRALGLIGAEEGLRLLLAGQGGARGAGGIKLRVGGLVGVRAPTWDVEVGGEKWTVGVDWVVL